MVWPARECGMPGPLVPFWAAATLICLGSTESVASAVSRPDHLPLFIHAAVIHFPSIPSSCPFYHFCRIPSDLKSSIEPCYCCPDQLQSFHSFPSLAQLSLLSPPSSSRSGNVVLHRPSDLITLCNLTFSSIFPRCQGECSCSPTIDVSC